MTLLLYRVNPHHRFDDDLPAALRALSAAITIPRDDGPRGRGLRPVGEPLGWRARAAVQPVRPKGLLTHLENAYETL